ncbi:hypothetical protein DFH09DRAFT_1103325 [Mycena vulgaris]|nr:hypothetical protein DFH09DRAFT_1103325 [Mycena vulgaris]
MASEAQFPNILTVINSNSTVRRRKQELGGAVEQMTSFGAPASNPNVPESNGLVSRGQGGLPTIAVFTGVTGAVNGRTSRTAKAFAEKMEGPETGDGTGKFAVCPFKIQPMTAVEGNYLPRVNYSCDKRVAPDFTFLARIIQYKWFYNQLEDPRPCTRTLARLGAVPSINGYKPLFCRLVLSQGLKIQRDGKNGSGPSPSWHRSLKAVPVYGIVLVAYGFKHAICEGKRYDNSVTGGHRGFIPGKGEPPIRSYIVLTGGPAIQTTSQFTVNQRRDSGYSIWVWGGEPTFGVAN